MRRFFSILFFSLLGTSIAVAQINSNHTDILFEKHFFTHLEADYIFRNINSFRFFEYGSVQPSQLSISGQKGFTFFKIAQINQGYSYTEEDLLKIAYAQSEFYFSELASFHLANYFFDKKDYVKSLEFIQMTTPFSFNNPEWKSLMYKKAYVLMKQGSYVQAYALFSSLNPLSQVAETPFGLFYEGYLACMMGEYAHALSLLKRVEKTEPFRQVAPILIAQAYVKSHDMDSVVWYAKSSAFEPQPNDTINFRTWHKIVAYSSFATQKYEEAVPHFQKLNLDIAKNENDLNLLYAFAFSLQEMKKYTLAIPLLEHLFTSTSSASVLHDESALLLANVHLKNDEKIKARTLYGNVSSSIQNPEKQLWATIEYVKLSLELGYVNDALAALDKCSATQDITQRQDIQDLQAQALALSKDYTTAYQVYRTLKDPSENLKKLAPTIVYAYALLQLKDNDYAVADGLLNEVKSMRYASSKTKHDVLFWRAEIAINRLNYLEALNYLDIYEENLSSKDEPEQSKKFAYNMGYLKMKEEEYADALSYFSKLLSASERSNLSDDEAWMMDAFVYQSDCYLMLKQYKKAYAGYEKISRLSTKYADYAYFQNCQIVGFQDVKEKEQRLAAFEKKFPRSPYLLKVNMERATIAMNDKRYAEAVPILQSIIDQSLATKDSLAPIEITEAWLNLALSYYHLHDNQKANETYKEILVRYPHTEASREALRYMKIIAVESNTVGQLKTFLGDSSLNEDVGADELDSLAFSSVLTLILNESPEEQVQKAAKDYIETNPNGRYVPRANYIVAEQLATRGRWKEALIYYQNIVRLPLNDFTNIAYVSIGKIAFFELKDYRQAQEAFEKIVEMSQDVVYVQDALRGLLRIYYHEKNWGLGYRIVKKIEQRPVNTSDDLDLIAIIYGKNFQLEANYDQAIQAYQKVPKSSYYYPETQYEIARCYMKQDKSDQAKEVALGITKLNTPNTFFYAKSYLILGEIFMKEKDYFNAKATFESLIKYSKSEEIKNEAASKLSEISVLETM